VGDVEERRRQHPRLDRHRERTGRLRAAGLGQLADDRRTARAVLPPSDNFFAETLVKDIGAAFGGTGTTAAGASVVSQTISSQFGITPEIVDGSGLSEADRTSVYEVADLLVGLAPTPVGAMLRGSMAIAARSGTLSERMRGTRAAGNCQGKTGTLTGYSNLVGYCNAANGHLLAFAIFDDAISTSLAHVIQDHMTITLADAKYTDAESARASRAILAPKPESLHGS
jgi:D-alanyl-D-alanine carboxypeptidase/D-alanyl-D-alanine-endopeptidase (penicillin-binding protein 4)